MYSAVSLETKITDFRQFLLESVTDESEKLMGENTGTLIDILNIHCLLIGEPEMYLKICSL